MTVVFIPRQRDGDNPGGLTVSKNVRLPEGEFQLDSYKWGSVTLWFVHDDNFTADERQQAYEHVRKKPELMEWATQT